VPTASSTGGNWDPGQDMVDVEAGCKPKVWQAAGGLPRCCETK
jgi:hypothetical protein